jgi:hypothetical protein
LDNSRLQFEFYLRPLSVPGVVLWEGSFWQFKFLTIKNTSQSFLDHCFSHSHLNDFSGRIEVEALVNGVQRDNPCQLHLVSFVEVVLVLRHVLAVGIHIVLPLLAALQLLLDFRPYLILGQFGTQLFDFALALQNLKLVVVGVRFGFAEFDI